MRKPVLAASLSLLLVPWSGVPASAAPEDPLAYHSLTPCLLFDTRPAFDPGGPGALSSGETRTFHVVGSSSDFASQGGTAGGCGIPGFSGGEPQTAAVLINLVAIDPGGGGNLKAWPTDVAEPAQGGVVNYQQLSPNLNNSNALALGVRQDSEGDDVSIKANGSPAHVRGVALGYFDLGEGFFWSLGGNAGTTPGTHFLGTTDNTAFQVHVNGERALRIEPGSSPNLIGGWFGNSVTPGAVGATIGGGGCPSMEPTCEAPPNVVTDDFGTVGGGVDNQAGDGAGNTADRRSTTVGGGTGNTASGDRATVGGGSGNTASGILASVGGGASNTASGILGTVGGGTSNTASGLRATVPGGLFNSAAGEHSLAAGRRGKANHQGAFVWADSSNFDFASTASDEFNVRAVGGTRIVSGIDGTGAPTAGVTLAPGGGSWSSISDRAVKDAVAPVDPTEVLEGVVAMPITSWSYQAQDPSIRHIGPMAQDFHDAFGVGEDERYITGVDADGVALAAIQGLNLELTALREEVEGRSGTKDSGVPSGAWWGLAGAIGLFGFGLGRRSRGAGTS